MTNIYKSWCLLIGFVIAMFISGCDGGGETAVEVGEDTASGPGCCQTSSSQCTDVNRASECRGLGGPGGGVYHAGLSCNGSTHKCE